MDTYTAWWEMLKNEHIALPTAGWLKGAVEMRMKSRSTSAMVDRVLGLQEKLLTPKAKRSKSVSKEPS